MKKHSNIVKTGASKNFDGSGSSSGSTQYQNLAPDPAPALPKLTGFMVPGSDSGSGSPALIFTHCDVQHGPANLQTSG